MRPRPRATATERHRVAWSLLLALGGGLSVVLPRCRPPDDVSSPLPRPPVLAVTDDVPRRVIDGVAASAPTPTYQDFLDDLAREFPFGRERQSVLAEMLAGASPETVEALLRLSFGDDDLNDVSHVLIERLAEFAPEAALAFAREKRFGVEPPWWHSVIGGLEDPRSALGDVLALPAGEVRTRFVGHIALRLGLADPQAGIALGRGLASPEERRVAVLNTLFAAARRDPAAGFELALAHGAETGEVRRLLRSIALDWALAEPVAARVRVEALPEGEARRSALEGLAAATLARTR